MYDIKHPRRKANAAASSALVVYNLLSLFPIDNLILHQHALYRVRLLPRITHSSYSVKRSNIISPNASLHRYVVSLALVLACSAALTILLRPNHSKPYNSSYGSFGTQDFIQFWSAYQIIEGGGNPYDADQLQLIQLDLGREMPQPRRMWHPPWVIVLLAPVLSLDFDLASTTLLFINLCLLMLSGLLLAKIYRPHTKGLLSIALPLSFAPAWQTLQLGQVSLILCLCVILFIYAMQMKHFTLAGFISATFSIKLHLFLLPLILILHHLIRKRSSKLLLGVIGGGTTLLIACYFLSTDVFTQWRTALQEPPLHWVVTSLVGIVRLALLKIGDGFQAWPVVVIPGLAAVMYLFILMQRKAEVDWLRELPLILCISLIVSPYAWFFDSCVILPVYLVLCFSALEDNVALRRLAKLAAIFGLQLIAFGLPYLGTLQQHHFFWYPIATAALYVWLSEPISVKRRA